MVGRVALRHLAYGYKAPTAMLAQALEILAEASQDYAAAPLGFRHSWETIAAGHSQRRRFVSAEAEQVEIHLHRGGWSRCRARPCCSADF
ncbi:hypothetical protein [Garicola koreensis]|uniref:Uncharacterized protein n=1 Tax=Garicola koreensis TaxID=1262554 RepID=A0A7W5TU53_9MICC|nr:hypothetical protein [Garicola koreensis]MBB3667588.1 hypothetical protein [Garicola koreensis]